MLRTELHFPCQQLCPCIRRPCTHFTLADSAMMSRFKNNKLRNIIRNDFNFATYVKNVVAMYYEYKIMSIQLAVQYGVDTNQIDPIHQRTALHYATMRNARREMRYLKRVMQVTLDIYGLPPSAYDHHFYKEKTTPENLISKIRIKSKKLFRFLYMGEIPASWSTSVLNSVGKKELCCMDPTKRHHLLTDARDYKGNSILHLAAKADKTFLIKYILNLDPNYANLKNLKQKTPSNYCKYAQTFSLFHEQWKRKVYFNRGQQIVNIFSELTCKYPDLVEIVRDPKRTIYVNNLDILYYFHTELNTYNMMLICRRALDMANNNLWHIFTEHCNRNSENMKALFDSLDVTMINNRNYFGETPLHLATNPIVKECLLKYGAHGDCLNNYNVMASHIIINLQCIAARNVPSQCYIPAHLLPIVSLHKPCI